MIRLGIDFQGWPICAKTLKEVLKDLNVIHEEEDGYYKIKADDIILDSYPCIFEDDGMGYGIKPKFIIEADYDVYTDKKFGNVFNIFVENG